jgi:hypothetical protein
MFLAWGIIGYVVVCRLLAGRDPNDPCPRPPLWKCFLAFIFGIIGGWVYRVSGSPRPHNRPEQGKSINL